MIGCRAKKFPHKAHCPFDERRSADILHDAPFDKKRSPVAQCDRASTETNWIQRQSRSLLFEKIRFLALKYHHGAAIQVWGAGKKNGLAATFYLLSVARPGIEPGTSWLWIMRSNQLSYRAGIKGACSLFASAKVEDKFYMTKPFLGKSSVQP